LIRAVLLDSGDTLIDESTEVRDDRGVVRSASFIPGARELVDELRRRGYLLALVADGLEASFRNILPIDAFDALAISEIVGAEKPDARMFRCALDALGVQAHESLMLGNYLARDVKGANALGILSVWLDWSPRRPKVPADETEIPRHTIREPLELLSILDL
jgi:putative hydrolase of the HAD superfamily